MDALTKTLDEMVIYQPTGLVLQPGLPFARWMEIMDALFKAEAAVQWYIGDGLNFGESAYGEKYSQVLPCSDLKLSAYKNYAWIANRFETSTRVDVLTWSHHRVVAAIEEPKRSWWLKQAVENGWSKRDLEREVKADGVHVGKNTGFAEWYTPAEYIAAARSVLGEIDLDPASSDIAQETVQASTYYTVDDDGLSKDWAGRVWLNPPYAAGVIDEFIQELVKCYLSGGVTAAVTLTNNSTDTKWFQLLATQAAAICLPAGRIRFINQEGEPSGAPLQGQMLCYLGEDWQSFLQYFQRFGAVMISYE